jgi:hypothetical protein
MVWKKTVLLLVVFPIVWFALAVSDARQFRQSILEMHDATTSENCSGVYRSKADCVLRILSEGKISSTSYFLINQSLPVLWGTLYVSGGILGAVASFWLLIFKGTDAAQLSWDKIIFRLLLGGFAGFVLFFILQLPAPLVQSFFAVKIATSLRTGQAGEIFPSSYFTSMYAFAILAGLFLGAFFERLESFFRQAIRNSPAHTTRHAKHP